MFSLCFKVHLPPPRFFGDKKVGWQVALDQEQRSLEVDWKRSRRKLGGLRGQGLGIFEVLFWGGGVLSHSQGYSQMCAS